MQFQGGHQGFFRQLSEPVKVTMSSLRFEDGCQNVGTSTTTGDEILWRLSRFTSFDTAEFPSRESSRGPGTPSNATNLSWTRQLSEPLKVNLKKGAGGGGVAEPGALITSATGTASLVPPLGQAVRKSSHLSESSEADTELPSPSSGSERQRADSVPVPGPINPWANATNLCANASAALLGVGALLPALSVVDAEGEDDPVVSTALILRTLPLTCTRGALIEEMKHAAFIEHRDFNLLVVPTDPSTGANFGYCLVNFVNISVRNAFAAAFSGRYLACVGMELEVAPASLKEVLA